MKTTLRTGATPSAYTSCSKISPVVKSPTRPMVPAKRNQAPYTPFVCKNNSTSHMDMLHTYKGGVRDCFKQIIDPGLSGLHAIDILVQRAEARHTRCAERAAHLAADLRRHTERVALAPAQRVAALSLAPVNPRLATRGRPHILCTSSEP